MHGTPAGLPFGMPGIGDAMDGAVQHAPHCGLHFMTTSLSILNAWASDTALLNDEFLSFQ